MREIGTHGHCIFIIAASRHSGSGFDFSESELFPQSYELRCDSLYTHIYRTVRCTESFVFHTLRAVPSHACQQHVTRQETHGDIENISWQVRARACCHILNPEIHLLELSCAFGPNWQPQQWNLTNTLAERLVSRRCHSLYIIIELRNAFPVRIVLSDQKKNVSKYKTTHRTSTRAGSPLFTKQNYEFPFRFSNRYHCIHIKNIRSVHTLMQMNLLSLDTCNLPRRCTDAVIPASTNNSRNHCPLMTRHH